MIWISLDVIQVNLTKRYLGYTNIDDDHSCVENISA
jgi:hypothetical protein